MFVFPQGDESLGMALYHSVREDEDVYVDCYDEDNLQALVRLPSDFLEFYEYKTVARSPSSPHDTPTGSCCRYTACLVSRDLDDLYAFD